MGRHIRRVLVAAVMGVEMGGVLLGRANADGLAPLPAPTEPAATATTPGEATPAAGATAAPPPPPPTPPPTPTPTTTPTTTTTTAPAPEAPPPTSPVPAAAPATASSGPPSPPYELRRAAPRFFTFSLGLGLSGASTAHASSSAGGLYVSGEYWAKPFSWLNLRSYLGYLSTSTTQRGCNLVGGCDVSENIGFLGAKLRLVAPFPWVAPYVEIGLGVSFGDIHATDVDTDLTTHGVVLDVPTAFGLSIGPHHDVDLYILELAHGGAQAFGGAFAVGVNIAAP